MFFLAWILFLILELVLKSNYSVAHYIMSAFGITSIGNSNWYVVVIIALYFSTYLSTLIASNQRDALIVNIVLGILLIFILVKFNMYSYWYDTIPAYIFGVAYSYFKPKILSFYKKNKANRWILFFVSLILTGVFGLLNALNPSIYYFILMELAFSMVFACFLSLFIVGNKIVITLGKYCFWIYILQRIPMAIFYTIPVIRNNIYIYFLLCLVVTGILSFAVNWLFNTLWGLIIKKKQKTLY